jgi:type II secretory pathway pseudopilin PulG
MEISNTLAGNAGNVSVTNAENQLRKIRVDRAFSLIEVTMALGICVFCLLAVLGLLPVGISANRDTLERTQAAGIAKAVQAELASQINNTGSSGEPRFKITVPAGLSGSPTPSTVFIARDCNSAEAAAQNSTDLTQLSRYRVDVSFGDKVSDTSPRPVRILVTWPALANQKVNQWPVTPSGAFDVVTVL